MRIKKNYKKISIEKEIYDRIIEDKQHFQEVIGGGKWSISDVIREYFKLIEQKK